MKVYIMENYFLPTTGNNYLVH